MINRVAASVAIKMLSGTTAAKKANPQVQTGGAPRAPVGKPQGERRFKSASDMYRDIDKETDAALREKK